MTITTTPPGGTQTQVVVGAVADARVLEASPTTNYGSLSRLDVDNPGEQSHLRFNVSGVSGAVQRATLRLFVRNGSSNGPSLYRTSAAWTEGAITWNNRPPATSGAIANVGTATAGTWSEYDLTGQVTGNGTHDFVLLPDSTDGIQYDSREGASAPQLVLEIGDGGSVNAPPVAVDDTATTLADTAVDINVAANDPTPTATSPRPPPPPPAPDAPRRPTGPSSTTATAPSATHPTPTSPARTASPTRSATPSHPATPPP